MNLPEHIAEAVLELLKSIPAPDKADLEVCIRRAMEDQPSDVAAAVEKLRSALHQAVHDLDVHVWYEALADANVADAAKNLCKALWPKQASKDEGN